MPKIKYRTGVYCWVNIKNWKRYVGSAAISFQQRKKGHLDPLRGNRHGNRHLQRAWNKYGEDSFMFVELEECPPEKCIEREQHWIDFFESANEDHGYNLSPTAGNTLGVKHTEQARANMSAAQKGKVTSPEGRARMIAGVRKAYANPVVRKRSADANQKRMDQETPEERAWRCRGIGGPVKEETKEKMRQAALGRKHSLESRKKIGDAQRGRKHTEEYKANMREATKGRVNTPECRERIRATKRIKCRTPEFREKMRQVVTAQWAKRRAAKEAAEQI